MEESFAENKKHQRAAKNTL